ncbi:hypothetical protein [Pandoraea pulmonicola]|jgi:hypothetical protein|uniref:Invasion protein invB n=1 Tax=Pandoraea pulmonicola TaxID=93221 RepID=A0AAJ4ZAW5_PANPU|nr:hypothetical protein [Pandoraea pulmonicola]AJC21246.1 hypothetical protein RO07_13505 [Pandoraea pulmonicola]SUA90059.1 Invasion protein invB [Pandoraea pulmonicola]
MNIDLISLVKEALAHAGCMEKLDEELDPHAAVELNFVEVPTIRIEAVDDAVVLSCCLSEYMASLRDCPTTLILDTVAPKAPWARHHTISLLEDGGDLHLTAVIADQYLKDGEGFSQSIDGFYERTRLLCEAIRA